jgi:2-isopropylmalate synthase
MLSELSRLLANYTKMPIHSSRPLVGKNAYTHKAGTHLAAIIQNPATYELLPPQAVGNTRRAVFGELCGKNGAAFLLRSLGIEPTTETSLRLAKGLKNLRCGDLFELELTDELTSLALTPQSNAEAGQSSNTLSSN